MRRLAPTLLASIFLWLSAGAQNRPASEWNQLDGNQTLFTVLAAMNSCGYDADLNSPTNHPMRAGIRKWVEAKKPASLPALRRFFAGHRAQDTGGDLSQYISWSLSVEDAPTFKPRFSANQMPPDAMALDALSPLLADFYREADIAEAWKQAQSAHEQEIRRYQAPVIQAIFDANAYLRNPTSGARGRRFQVFLDLLGAPNQVHTRAYGEDYYVVVTPSAEPRIRDIRHAYLHYLLDPLAMRNAAVLDKKKGLADLAQASPILDDVYKNDFTLLAGMCLVKAVEARIDRRDGPEQVTQAMSEGFILTAYFHEAFLAYEKQEQALRLYLPSMIEAIDLRKEDQRIGQVRFTSQRAVRKARTVEVPVQAPEPTGPAKAAADAEKLYTDRNLPAARDAYRKVLEQPAARPVHARCYFGLARIALLEKQLDQAEQMFERTLEMEPEAYERSWSYIYLARLGRATVEPDLNEVRKNYRAALAVQDAPEGAVKAAQQELAALPPIDKPSNPQ